MDAGRPPSAGTVRDWMTREPTAVPPDITVREVAGLMRSRGIRHVLVVDGDRLVGIVSERDVRARIEEGAPPLFPDSPISRAMSEPPVTVAPETPLVEAARAMLEGKIGALPVVEAGRPIGILTRSDALEALLAWAESASASGA